MQNFKVIKRFGSEFISSYLGGDVVEFVSVQQFDVAEQPLFLCGLIDVREQVRSGNSEITFYSFL